MAKRKPRKPAPFPEPPPNLPAESVIFVLPFCCGDCGEAFATVTASGWLPDNLIGGGSPQVPILLMLPKLEHLEALNTKTDFRIVRWVYDYVNDVFSVGLGPFMLPARPDEYDIDRLAAIFSTFRTAGWDVEVTGWEARWRNHASECVPVCGTCGGVKMSGPTHEDYEDHEDADEDEDEL